MAVKGPWLRPHRCYVRFTKTVNGAPTWRNKVGPSPPRWPSRKKGFELERGRYGPIFPRTPACYGFSIIAKVKEGREESVRAYGKTIQETIASSPEALAPLRLHYLRWVLFDVGSGLHFQYQGIFDTDFDKYTEDAVALFSATGITTVFTNLEGFPEDWKENPEAFVKFVREHHYPSFLEHSGIGRCHALQLLAAAASDDHLVAQTMKRFSQATTDPRTATGHQNRVLGCLHGFCPRC